MNQSQIASLILRHDARNLQLKRRLAERGIDWRNEYQITCRFRSGNQQQAMRLAAELYKKGFTEVKEARVPGKAGFWRVLAQAWQSVARSASHEFTEDMVRTAAELSCFYDGWEASISAPEGDGGCTVAGN